MAFNRLLQFIFRLEHNWSRLEQMLQRRGLDSASCSSYALRQLRAINWSSQLEQVVCGPKADWSKS